MKSVQSLCMIVRNTLVVQYKSRFEGEGGHKQMAHNYIYFQNCTHTKMLKKFFEKFFTRTQAKE